MGVESKSPYAIYGAVALSSVIHAVMIAYGEWQDRNLRVAYTDIDYWVYSDAATHVYNGGSAFDRQTYRYTPLLAWALVPNEILGGWWGKALFSAAGVLSGILIYRLTNRSVMYASLWLFSPLTINISTRGSSDSLTIVLILLVFHELKAAHLNWAAVWYGLAVHLRIFPIFFVVPIIMHLGSFKKVLQFGLISGGVCMGLVGLFYLKDGYRFLYEAYLYHFVRKDHRHNFSLFYYAIYLASTDPTSLLSKILHFSGFVPQLGSLLFVGIRYGRENFMFSIFLQTVIFVAFNKVITAQYFLWYFGLLPVALYFILENSPNKGSTIIQVIVAIVAWGATEVFWLRASYRLEVEGEHNFKELLTASASLFAAHITLCVVFIHGYDRAHRIKKSDDIPLVPARVRRGRRATESSEEKSNEGEETQPRRSKRIESAEANRAESVEVSKERKTVSSRRAAK